MVGALLLCVVPIVGMAQPVEPLSVMRKLNFHARSVGSPMSLTETAAYAGILQGLNSPRERGQGGGAYGKRLASALGGSGFMEFWHSAWTRHYTRTL